MHKGLYSLINLLLIGALLVGCATRTQATEEPDSAYRDPGLAIADRVKDLLAQMTLAEKIGQMTQVEQSDAFVAAWLPGTEGQGVADVLFGDYPFTGKLPYTWPRLMDQIPFDFNNLETSGPGAPLFPFGYGLDAEGG